MLDDESVLDVALVVTDPAGMNFLLDPNGSEWLPKFDLFPVNTVFAVTEDLLEANRDRLGMTPFHFAADREAQIERWGYERLALASSDYTPVPEAPLPDGRYRIANFTTKTSRNRRSEDSTPEPRQVVRSNETKPWTPLAAESA